MSLEDLKATFTTDEEINEWVVMDESTELIGYVDLIEGIRSVISNGKPTILYKITVNNNFSNRVKVLFWGELAKKYSTLIQDRTIIKIVRARTVLPKAIFHNPHDVVVPIQLSILTNTAIKLYDYKFEEKDDLTVAPTIKISNVLTFDGQCKIEGYLKQEFIKMTTYGRSFYAGVLVDGKYKISVKLTQESTKDNLKKGLFLRILGKVIQHQNNAPQFVARSSEDIAILTDKEMLEDAALHKIGYCTPIRKHDSDETNQSYKKNPF